MHMHMHVCVSVYMCLAAPQTLQWCAWGCAGGFAVAVPWLRNPGQRLQLPNIKLTSKTSDTAPQELKPVLAW